MPRKMKNYEDDLQARLKDQDYIKIATDRAS